MHACLCGPALSQGVGMPCPRPTMWLLRPPPAARRAQAANASSAVMKRQFERKAKAAQVEISFLRKVLYGLS